LASETTNLADVVEDHDATRDLAIRPLYRRCGELRRELSIRHLAHQERASAEIHSPPFDEALLHRIPERRAIDLVDERDQVADPLPDRDGPRGPDQLLRRLVHVIDRSVRVRRDHALTDRFEGDPRLKLA